MRVGFISYGLDRPLSGVTRYSSDLACALNALADAPDMTLLRAGGSGALAQLGLAETALPGCQRLPGLLSIGNFCIPIAARTRKLDVVHDPNGFAPLLFGAGGACSIVTLHDTFPWSLPGTSSQLDTLIHRHWLPIALRRVQRIITDSNHSKAEIVAHLGVAPAKIAVVPLAVDQRYQPADPDAIGAVRARYGLPPRYILSVGALQVRKNIHGLLRACALLWAQGHAPPLVVVGSRAWNYGPIFDTLRELGCGEQVIFTGYVPDADLPAVYSGAELLAFPSLYEGFGLPPLEAMACGTPVVCSNSSSLPEVVGDAALTIDPYDSSGLARAIRLVIEQPTLAATLRTRGSQRAAMFTWQRTARSTMNIYTETLAASRGAVAHAQRGSQ